MKFSYTISGTYEADSQKDAVEDLTVMALDLNASIIQVGNTEIIFRYDGTKTEIGK